MQVKRKKRKLKKKKKLQKGRLNRITVAPRNLRSVVASVLLHARALSAIALPVFCGLEIISSRHDLLLLVRDMGIYKLFLTEALPIVSCLFSVVSCIVACIVARKQFNGKSALTAVSMRLRSREKGQEEISIVGLMAKRILAETYMASGYVASATTLTLTVMYLVQHAISILVLLLGTSLVFLFGLRYLLFAYRVQAGYYGSNISEAREIIEFIHRNAADPPGGKGGGGKEKISPTIKTTAPETFEHSIWGIGARHA